jgi:putative ABC transport system permease protein
MSAYVDGLTCDFRYAVRALHKDRRVALTAIFVLALGICASAVVFSVVYNSLFETLPYRASSRLVVFGIRNLENAGGWKARNFLSLSEFRGFRELNHVLEDVIAYNDVRIRFDDGQLIRYWPTGAIVSGNTFQFLGVAPYLGRAICEEDSKADAPYVFVMNYRFWQSEFGGDPKILGTNFVLDGMPRTLVGIMPRHFNAFGAAFYLPARPGPNGPSLDGGSFLIGRLKPGANLKIARADLDDIAHRLQKENPKGIFPERFAVIPQSLLDSLIGDFKKTLYGLIAAVFLLHLIGCSNVANLLLARATSRERETAVRAAMGASRGRLVRQFLAESFLLTVWASGIGCGLAYLVLKSVVTMIPDGTLPDESVIRMNVPVLLLSLGVTVFTAVLCGLAPAFHTLHRDLRVQLAGNGRGNGGGFRPGKLRAGLVVSEVALSILLLIGAGLLMRSFVVLTRVDLGFNPKNVLYFRLDPGMYSQLPDRRIKQNILTRRLLDELNALPGVVSASESIQEPPLNYDWSDTIIPGKPHTERWETRYEMCSAGYFQTLGLPLLRGRFFSEADVNAERYVMVVNQAFARQYFPDADPLGHKVKLEVLDRSFLDVAHDIYFEIVGVAGDYKTRGPESWQSFPEVFVPYSVQGFSWRTFMIRTSLPPSSFFKNINQKLRATEPGIFIVKSGTLEDSLREFYRGPRFALVTLGTFATMGLLLVAIGIFSVMAYTVSLQLHEIGIRMALGAQRRNILRIVVLKGFRLLSGGILLGLASGYALTRFLASQISDVSATDPATFAAVAVIVMSAGLIACILPAHRAARVDPLVALRYE